MPASRQALRSPKRRLVPLGMRLSMTFVRIGEGRSRKDAPSFFRTGNASGMAGRLYKCDMPIYPYELIACAEHFEGSQPGRPRFFNVYDVPGINHGGAMAIGPTVAV